MFNLEIIKDVSQNKNFMMFVTSLVFMAGILAYFNSLEIIVSAILGVVLLFLFYFKIINFKQLLIYIFIFYLGFFISLYKIKKSDDLVLHAPNTVNVTGKIITIPELFDNNKVKFFFEVNNIDEDKIKAKTYVTISGDEEKLKDLKIGSDIKLEGKLRKPFSSTNPSQFDYGSYLKNFNTFTTIYADSDKFQIIDSTPTLKWKFLQKLNDTRARILKSHSKYLKSPNLEILGGIVFGDDAVSTPKDIKNSFINSGLLHILAASGMNVAFIFTFWFFILKRLRVPYKFCVISGMFVVILYTLMTGLGASVIRAALMLLFVLLGKLIDRDTHSVSLLAFVAVLMLFYNPAYINDVSFQLSFCVTFGLLTTANIIFQKLEKLPNWLLATILIPVVAQLWVIPIQMFYFNTFSLYSIPANISTVSLLSVISFGGFISSVLAIIPMLSDIVCKIFDFFLNYLLNILVFISDFFANLKHCIVQTTHPSIIQMILYYVMLIGATYLIKYNRYKKAFITVVLLSTVLLCSNLKPISKDFEVIAFDVQNADAFLLKTPQNKYFIIDTGKAPYDSGNSQAKIIILKYLKDRGIKDIEGVIVTHFDNDHAGGTVDILNNTKTNNLYLNSTKVDTQTGRNIFKTIKETNQNYKIVTRDENIYTEPDFNIKLLRGDFTKGKDLSNANSIVTLVSYKDFDVLFMGDAGIETYEQIKLRLPKNIEVLKVGHHGGPRVVSADMVENLGIETSIISTGVNYFGHPNKGTLDILRNTQIYRTDLQHSIKITSDGTNYKVLTYDTNKKDYKQKQVNR